MEDEVGNLRFICLLRGLHDVQVKLNRCISDRLAGALEALILGGVVRELSIHELCGSLHQRSG